MTRRALARGTHDPYGLGPVATYLAPVAAAVALVVVAVVTLGLMNGQLPLQRRPGNDGGQVVNRTPAPSNVVIPEPVPFLGSIVYAKAGNIWVQTADNVRQVTDFGHDSMPSFSPDGKSILFIREYPGHARFRHNGGTTWFDLATPELMRMAADGSAPPEKIVSGTFKSGKLVWFSWIRQPVLSPDGHTIAVVSDAPDPTKSDVVVQFYDLEAGKFAKPRLAEFEPLGHQDPAWRPDGKVLLFVRNNRDGSRGAPQIIRFTPATGKSAVFTGPGYLAPSYSPDGRFVAATRTDSFGTEVVVLDETGAEVLRVTDDDHSFSPVWSPGGDGIAYLHIDGQIVDLELAKLDATSGTWKVTETTSLTAVSGLDAGSRPSWFIPASQLPEPTATPGSSGASASPAGSAGASAAP